MSKRVRGTVRTHRPGTRPTSERVAAPRRRTLDERPSQLEAATVVAEEVVEHDPAQAADELQRVARATHPRHRTKAGSLLAARAATEYVYVAQDMRRILAVAAVLIAALIVLWALLVVMKVVPLPFY